MYLEEKSHLKRIFILALQTFIQKSFFSTFNILLYKMNFHYSKYTFRKNAFPSLLQTYIQKRGLLETKKIIMVCCSYSWFPFNFFYKTKPNEKKSQRVSWLIIFQNDIFGSECYKSIPQDLPSLLEFLFKAKFKFENSLQMYLIPWIVNQEGWT